MRILLVTSPIVSLREPFAGGTEAFVVNFANHLCKKGHEVEVLCKNACETNRFNTILLSESPLRMSDNLVPESEGQKLFQASQYGLIDSSYYDLIHYHSYYYAMYDLAMLHDTPSVITLHSPVSAKLSLVHKYHKQRSNSVYVAVSERLTTDWERAIGPGILTIPNGIDLSDTRLQQNNDKQQHAFWMGRICPEKDLVSAIAIANRLHLRLKIAGPISDSNYFNHKVKPLLSQTVEYLGHLRQAELFNELGKSQIFLATSSWEEPFGLATLEALACGVPVLGFESAIPRELRDPTVSITINHFDQAEASFALLRSASKEDCVAFASRFNFNHTVSKYEKIYDDII